VSDTQLGFIPIPNAKLCEKPKMNLALFYAISDLDKLA
jgi:hypothetical protein